jgi:hypothetical protein
VRIDCVERVLAGDDTDLPPDKQHPIRVPPPSIVLDPNVPPDRQPSLEQLRQQLDQMLDTSNTGATGGSRAADLCTPVSTIGGGTVASRRQIVWFDKLTGDARTLIYAVYRNVLQTAQRINSNIRRMDLVEIVAKLARTRTGTIYRLLRMARAQFLADHQCARLTLTKTTSATFLPGARRFLFHTTPPPGTAGVDGAGSAVAAASKRRAHAGGSSGRHGQAMYSEREKYGVNGAKLRRLRRLYAHARRVGKLDEVHSLWLVYRECGVTLMSVDKMRIILYGRGGKQRHAAGAPPTHALSVYDFQSRVAIQPRFTN